MVPLWRALPDALSSRKLFFRQIFDRSIENLCFFAPYKKLCLPYEVVSAARIQKHKKVLESLIFVGKRARSRKKLARHFSTPVKGPN